MVRHAAKESSNHLRQAPRLPSRKPSTEPRRLGERAEGEQYRSLPAQRNRHAEVCSVYIVQAVFGP
jgi:hypothetical protein